MLTQRVYSLDQPMRQQHASDGLYSQLMAARAGRVPQPHGVQYWNQRALVNLPDRRDFGIDVPGVVHLCCRVREKVELNTAYIRSFTKSIVAHASFQGPHAISDDDRRCGGCKAIPLRTALSVGMFVKLTVNIKPESGLCNGSRGMVRDIVYENGGYDPSALPIVLVEFPEYDGPQLLDSDGTRLVPICAQQRVCDCGRCFRHGLPLVSGKADTGHSAQGITCGEGEQISSVVLYWDRKAEDLWPGIFYVLASRAKELAAIALARPFSTKDAQKVGVSKRAEAARNEMQRLQRLADQHMLLETRTFEEGLQQFVQVPDIVCHNFCCALPLHDAVFVSDLCCLWCRWLDHAWLLHVLRVWMHASRHSSRMLVTFWTGGWHRPMQWLPVLVRLHLV